MPSLADLLNSPTEIEFEGVTYHLRGGTLEEYGKYQRWLEQEARASASASVELPDADRRQLLRDVNADIAAQLYAWGGEVCVNSLMTPSGMGKLLSIVCGDQGVTWELGKRMCEAELLKYARLVLAIQDGDDAEKKAALATALASVGLSPNYLSAPSSASPTTPAAPPTSSPSAS